MSSKIYSRCFLLIGQNVIFSYQLTTDCSTNYAGPLAQNLKIKPKFSRSGSSEKVVRLELNFNDVIVNGIGEAFPNLKALKIKSENRVLNVERRHFSQMPNLENLNLSNNRIKVIAEDAFHDLTNLKVLNLRDCEIEIFSDLFFQHLTDLRQLNLGGNFISSQNAFKDLVNLKLFVVPKVDIIKKLIQHLPGLTVLIFYKHNLENLEKSFFVNMQEMEKITFGASVIKHIKENAFEGFTRLHELDLQRSEIESISETSFWGLTTLKMLDLDYNRIKFIPEKCFQDLTELQTLSLTDNPIDSLHPNLFKNLRNLDSLILSSNPIKVIHENIFTGMKNLKNLHLRSIELEALPTNLFQMNTKLETINLIQNNLNKIEVDFTSLKMLKELYLSGCVSGHYRKDWPQSTFSSIQELQDLILRHCNRSTGEK